MTVVPAATYFSYAFVFNIYSFSIASLVVKEINPRNIPLLLNDVQVSALVWEEVILDEITYFYGTIPLQHSINRLNFLAMTNEFGAVIYGFSEIDHYMLYQLE